MSRSYSSLSVPLSYSKWLKIVERPVARVLDEAGADLLRAQERREFRHRVDFVLAHFGPARDGNHAIVGRTRAGKARRGRGSGDGKTTERLRAANMYF